MSQDQQAAMKSPAFQFYPKDYLADESQATMSLQETGAYIRLLCRCWLEGSIPDDVVLAARLVGEAAPQMRKCWPTVRRCFREHPTEQGRLIHARLEKEREKQQEHRRRQSDKGKASAAKRSAEPKAAPTGNQPSTVVQPDRQPTVNSSISSLQSSPSGSKNAREDDGADHPVAVFMQDTYPKLYAKARNGAAIRLNEARDFEVCVGLLDTYGQRVPVMLEYFLNMPSGKDVLNQPGTPRQFAHMAPQVDAELRRHGR